MMSSSSSSSSTALNSTAALAAFTSTALISIAPNVLLLLFPHYGSGEGQHSFVLSLGQAIAAGGLLGDVFLHVIPHAAGGHHNSTTGSNGHDTMGLWLLLGFSIFLVTDMVIRQLNHSNNTTHGGHSHGNNNNNKSESSSHQKTIHEHPEHKQSLVLLNLAADALHNFTDGLAIGASFSNYAGKSADSATTSVLEMIQSRGGLATVSILFHEIPHELGDFAILVKEGFSKRQAILAQFGTAVAAMMGTYVGLLTAHVAGDELMFVTAGGFVYLATVNILPELLDEGRSWKFRLVQLLFFAMGIGFLYAVSLLEGMDEHSHSGHHSHGHHHHHHHSQRPPEEEVLEHHHMHHAHHTDDTHETSHDSHDHSHGHGHGHHHYDDGEF